MEGKALENDTDNVSPSAPFTLAGGGTIPGPRIIMQEVQLLMVFDLIRTHAASCKVADVPIRSLKRKAAGAPGAVAPFASEASVEKFDQDRHEHEMFVRAVKKDTKEWDAGGTALLLFATAEQNTVLEFMFENMPENIRPGDEA